MFFVVINEVNIDIWNGFFFITDIKQLVLCIRKGNEMGRPTKQQFHKSAIILQANFNMVHY